MKSKFITQVSWLRKKIQSRHSYKNKYIPSLLNSSTLATLSEELTHWKRLWCWEGLGAGEEGDDRGWDSWMASPTRWTWVWVDSGSWWWTGRPSVLQFMGSQRVEHDWVTELNWMNSVLKHLQLTKIFMVTLSEQVLDGNFNYFSTKLRLWFSKL